MTASLKLLPVFAATLIAGSAAAAPPVQRPNRVTENPVSTTNKVLVAVPTDRLGEYDYLYVVTPGGTDAHGIPVAVDGATPFNSTLVVMNAPLLDARDGFWGRNFLRAEATGFDTFSLGSSAPEGNRDLGRMPEGLRDAMQSPLSVIASAGPRLADLPERLQRDPWALLNAGRHRDAGAVFAAAEAGPERDAGMALAAALLGRLDAAGERLAALDASALPARLPIGAGLAARIRGLADGVYAGAPAGVALTAMADAASVLDPAK